MGLYLTRGGNKEGLLSSTNALQTEEHVAEMLLDPPSAVPWHNHREILDLGLEIKIVIDTNCVVSSNYDTLSLFLVLDTL
jgi:hypothetical protein